ncbi:MAG: hypothetical protein K0R29_291 [Pseudobdellovibrio sp.]|jgi:hypothetical protein|nr:hypothetical protein [Pseudobdellovibrio sp.]
MIQENDVKQHALKGARRALLIHKLSMKFLSLMKKVVIAAVVVFLFVWIFGTNYSFVFKRRVVGEVVAVERVDINGVAVVTGNTQQINPQVFSFSVGIKDKKSGEIFMASSEDRQWAAVTKGNCVIAAYFPYPPWNLSKANTNHNARLMRNFVNCEQLVDDDSIWEKLRFFFLMN